MDVATTIEPWPTSGEAGRQESEHPVASTEPNVSIPRFTEYAPAGVRSPASSQPSSVQPAKRPKGRLFVGAILVAVCGMAVYNFWHAYFRYSAHGVVEGHVIQVPPPWEGVVQHVYVQDGEQVQQDQLLVTLDNPAMRQQLARLEEDLRLAQATLAAETARLHLSLQDGTDRRQKAVAEYYEAWGNLLNERAQLNLAKRRTQRASELAVKKVNTRDDVESATFAEDGQRQKVEKLEIAVQELRQRAELDSGHSSDATKQLEPHVLRIESLRAETARCGEELAKGQVRAPVGGVVLKRECLSGDHAFLARPMLALLEADTVKVALYVPQNNAALLAVGDRVEIDVEPNARSVRCNVVRVGQRFEPAPQSIQRYYHSDQPLLPVYLRPDHSANEWLSLRVGGIASLSRSWWPAWLVSNARGTE